MSTNVSASDAYLEDNKDAIQEANLELKRSVTEFNKTFEGFKDKHSNNIPQSILNTLPNSEMPTTIDASGLHAFWGTANEIKNTIKPSETDGLRAAIMAASTNNALLDPSDQIDKEDYEALIRALTPVEGALKTVQGQQKEYFDLVDQDTKAGIAIANAIDIAFAPTVAVANAIFGQNKVNAAISKVLPSFVPTQVGSLNLIDALPQTQVVYREQCFLLSNIIELAQRNKYRMEKLEPKKLPYQGTPPEPDTADPNMPQIAYNTPSNACLMVDGDSFGFINRLTQYNSTKDYFNIDNHKLSSLVPMIRLFKVNNDQNTQTEFSFDSNLTKDDLSEIFVGQKQRGVGVGIKRFTFSYDGSNPFAVKKSIQAKLVIFANSFAELLRERKGYRYVDLALKTGKGPASKKNLIKDMEENLSKLNFRLKAVVGWAAQNNDSIVDNTLLNNSFVTLNLTPTIHEFDFDEMGRVTFTINYLAYIDDFFDHPRFNIFSDLEISRTSTIRKLKFKSLSADCSTEDIQELKKADKELIQQEKEKGIQRVIQSLFEAQKVKYISITKEEVQDFIANGPFATMPSLEGKIFDNLIGASSLSQEYLSEINAVLKQSSQNTDLTDMQRISILLADPTREDLPFFYVSDLMDVVMSNIEQNLVNLPGELSGQNKTSTPVNVSPLVAPATQPSATEQLKVDIDEDALKFEIDSINKFEQNYKRFRLLLGPLELVDPRGIENSAFVNLGDIPVSVKYFVEWITEKVLKKDNSEYFLSAFLTDFINTLLSDFINDDGCFYINTKQKVRLFQNTITSYPSSRTDEITKLINASKRKSRYIIKDNANYSSPLLNVSGDIDDAVTQRKPEDEINYMIFYAGRVQPTDLMKGNRASDENRGIFHYLLGKDKGIVKNITLEKSDTKFLKEVRFEQEGYDGLEQLREVYNVSINTFPLVNAFPGTYIYVDPEGFSPGSKAYLGDVGDLTRYGIGGYHMIIQSEHSFGPGEAESTITAKWVQQIESESASASVKKDGSASDNPSKCKKLLDKRKEASEDESFLQELGRFVTDALGIPTDSVSLPPDPNAGTP